MSDVERHPLEPFIPEGARLLMLGSFPPARRRWCMDFFYPNFINDMWRIFGLVFFGDKEHFVDKASSVFRKEAIVSLLIERGIALYDTACEVRRLRDNASDKFLEIVSPTDIIALLPGIPDCRAIVTTGQKAAETAAVIFGCQVPATGTFEETEGRVRRLWRMPSTSRAYPLSIEKKAEAYRKMFTLEGLI